MFIPAHLHSIGGNSFANGPAPPPPPYAPPPPRRPHNNHNPSQMPPESPGGPEGQAPSQDHIKNKTGLTDGQIAGVVIGSVLGGLCVVLAVAFCFWNVYKGKKDDTKGRSRDIERPPSVVADGGMFNSGLFTSPFKKCISCILMSSTRSIRR